MKRALLVVVGFLLSTNALADEQSNMIPLDQIWGYNLPGTRDIQTLDKDDPTVSGRRLAASISESLILRAEDLGWQNISRAGFAVVGTGLSALRAAHSVLVAGKKPSETFSPNEGVTIVFFSELAPGNQVQIERVERDGNNIEIRYRLRPYIGGGKRSLNLALIPLGKLLVGKYAVEMKQIPREQKFINYGLKPLDSQWSQKFLCKPFSFRVTENGQ